MSGKRATLFLGILLTVCLNASARHAASQSWVSVDSMYKEFVHVHLNTTFLVAGESLLFKVYCMDERGRSSSISTIAYVELIGEDGNVLAQLKTKLMNGQGSGDYFIGGSVPTGNYTLIVYTKWMRNFGDTQIWRRTITVINPAISSDVKASKSPEKAQTKGSAFEASPHVRLDMSGFEFGQRERVSLKITNDAASSWFFSASVRMYSRSIEEASNEWMRNENKIGGKPDLKFLPDMRGELITGLVRNKSTGQPASRQLVSLSSPANRFDFHMSTTDVNGRYYFNVDQMNADVNLINVFPDGQGGLDISVENNFIEDHKSFIPARLTVDSAMKSQIEQRILYAQIENAFFSVKKDSILQRSADTRFFAVPDKIYQLDDFTRFPTMEDVLREIIPEVVVKARDGKFSLTITSLTSGERLSGPPLMLIDGVPIMDANVLMQYDPAKVKTIALSTRHYFYGGFQSDGIISIETYDGNAANISRDGMHTMKYVRPSFPKIFYSPSYEADTDLARVPDFRVQLYWNPDIVILPDVNRSISFYTGDIAGQYVVEVVGISNTGAKLYWTKTFFVK